MFARVATYSGGDLDELVHGFDAARPALERIEGFSHACFCVNHDSGKALSMTVWEDAETLEASAERADQLREWAVTQAGATTDSVTQYEVAVTVQKALVATVG
jgi:heme-degrading monooxygenase HmoA